MAIFPLFLAGSIAAAPPPAVQLARGEAAIHPALWVVRDSDTTIYLFGTFHALDGTTNWFKGDVKTAFDRSKELVLETLVPEFAKAKNANEAAEAQVSGRATAQFAQQAAPVVSPQPMPRVAPPASLLASTQMVMAASHARGMSTSEGADAVLREVAEERGEPVAGLETFEFQLSMFTSLPSPATPAQASDPQMMQKISIALAQLQDDWNRGDIEAFQPMLDQMRAQTPLSYQKIFVERNGHWAHWIADRLKKPGIVFVAVGAGHLAGPDSVQNQLAALGVKATRID